MRKSLVILFIFVFPTLAKADVAGWFVRPLEDNACRLSGLGKQFIDSIPSDWASLSNETFRWTEALAPEALARQERGWGILLPSTVDPSRPMVIIVHGLDGDAQTCRDLQKLLADDGSQTALFCYPADQSIDASSRLFAQHFAALRDAYPRMKIEIVTQSMGALVVRDYVEGPDYIGGVDRLILIAPPNGGSSWARYAILCKLAVNGWRWRHDPGWSPAWMVGEGFCQAGEDLEPGSELLNQLNSRPRAAGVKYTIIEGDEPAADHVAADAMRRVGGWLPDCCSDYWPIRPTNEAIQCWADLIQNHIGDADGPVSLTSASLAGVTDVVRLHADHLSLYESIDGEAPAAWPIVRDRLHNHGG
jgi:pimeloyl-ACP methyl ester carboxylesterase